LFGGDVHQRSATFGWLEHELVRTLQDVVSINTPHQTATLQLIGAMMALVDRAIALNPSFARGWHISGVLKLWAGQPDLAIEHIETALRLSPRASVGSSLLNIAASYFFLERFDQAIPRLLLAIQEDPGRTIAYRQLAACYAHLGRIEEAREALARLQAITPVVMPDLSWLKKPEHRELLLSGLRLAMGETT
jgi:tetratricopeptide (TPR) repeat protein